VNPDHNLTDAPAPPRAEPPVNWSTQQLTGFLAMVSSAEDGRTASRVAVERAAEALGAEVAVLMSGGEIQEAVGFSGDPILGSALAEVAEGRASSVVVPRFGECRAVAITVEAEGPVRLVLARSKPEGFGPEEVHLARGMARVLGLSLRLFRFAAEERRQRHEAETQSELNQRLLESLQERQELLERLARIQRSITHGAVREDVLDAICQGALELLGDDVAALRLLVPDSPGEVEIVAVTGRDEGNTRGIRHSVEEGVGGFAISEGRLVVTENYQNDTHGLQSFRDGGVHAAMAAPVHEHGRTVGSLVVASYQEGRRYSSIERDMLVAFADHASLALSDSRTIQAMREADAARIQARFRSLVDSSSDMITVIDAGGEIVYTSPSVERTLVSPQDGLEGTPLTLLIHPEDRGRALELLARARTESGPTEPAEWRMRGADGAWLEVETIATGQLDDPNVQGIVLNSRSCASRSGWRASASSRAGSRTTSTTSCRSSRATRASSWTASPRRTRCAPTPRRSRRPPTAPRGSRASCSCSAAARSCSTASWTWPRC
jgi:PAS domain S-box-containing protein